MNWLELVLGVLGILGIVGVTLVVLGAFDDHRICL